MDTVRNIIIFIIVGYVAICIFLFVFQRSFIYFPSKNIESFESYGLDDFKEIQLKTDDNVKIFAWYKKPVSQNLPVIVMFHGNAGNLLHRIPKLLSFSSYEGYGVLAIDYRGYGNSGGKPSEQGLYADARAAMDYLAAQGISKNRTILYG